MSSSISNLSSYLQSIINTSLQNTRSTTNTIGGSLSGINSVSDNSQLSPFAELLNTLQELQQSNPTEYQQVTQQIATNLQSAARTAQSEGNTTAANQLNTLATDFTNASQSGQLPNIQDLAQAIGGGGRHHHHHGASSDSDSNSSASSSSSTSSTSDSSSASQTVSQLLAAFQANGAHNESLNPMAIIMNTLQSAGISSSNS
jgi:hypothetical protein